MKISLACTAGLALGLIALGGQADAKGCIKGAVVGGVAGHMAGHGKMGAAAGCAVFELAVELSQFFSGQAVDTLFDVGCRYAHVGHLVLHVLIGEQILQCLAVHAQLLLGAAGAGILASVTLTARASLRSDWRSPEIARTA